MTAQPDRPKIGMSGYLSKDDMMADSQIQKFDDAIAEVIDAYLKEGMDPDDMRLLLQEQIVSDLHGRRLELEQS
jgi:hypothetical protein